MSRESLRPSGKEIKKALIDLDLSYMQLAKAVGCSVYYIREITAETRKAHDMRKKIARYLDKQMEKQGLPHKWNDKKEKVA
jgi:ribosome-binding protein aMBF1 (putative translation factor)